MATATDLLRLGRFSKACYFAQQAAEKALKALLIKKLNRYVHTHSVRELLEMVREGGISVGEDLLRLVIYLIGITCQPGTRMHGPRVHRIGITRRVMPGSY